jgi:hypothetical protein
MQPWGGRAFLNPPGGYADKIGRTIKKKKKNNTGEPGCTISGSCVPAAGGL